MVVALLSRPHCRVTQLLLIVTGSLSEKLSSLYRNKLPSLWDLGCSKLETKTLQPPFSMAIDAHY